MNWPTGSGRDFTGVIERSSGQYLRFEKAGVGGSKPAILHRHAVNDPNNGLSAEQRERLADELELLEVAGDPFDLQQFLAGAVSPVFFGSALTNFGVEPFFDAFVELAPPPSARPVTLLSDGSTSHWDPATAPLSAYVFKIQANMDPRHRDSLAFVRICSGVLDRDAVVKQIHRGSVVREIRLSRPATLVASERNILDAAWPGDVVGLVNAGFRMGDTIIDASVAKHDAIEHAPLPLFAPAVFARVVLADNSKRKSFDKGVEQLAAEGSVLLLKARGRSGEPPIAGALGRLQFEVLQSRLQHEYGVAAELTPLPYVCASWLVGDPNTFAPPTTALVVEDARNHIGVLFTSTWDREHAERQNPQHQLHNHA